MTVCVCVCVCVSVCECVWTSTALVHKNITICQASHLYILFSNKDDHFQRVHSLEIAIYSGSEFKSIALLPVAISRSIWGVSQRENLGYF